jgi:hypothetical protein
LSWNVARCARRDSGFLAPIRKQFDANSVLIVERPPSAMRDRHWVGRLRMNPVLMAAFGLIAVLLWRAGPGFAAVTGGTALSAALLLLTLH